MPGAAFQKIDLKLTIGAVALSVIYAAWVIATSSLTSFYTLDDPYIHMALAENIARGHFGVNLGEVSNPSSSILWPWLLAAFEKIGLMVWAPLLVNIACFVLSLRLMLAFCLKRMAADERQAVSALIVIGAALLAFNLFGVIFTGMEHSLHVLLCIVAVTRVIDGKYDGLTLAALAIGPLVRFEGAIVLALGVGAALYDRKWRFAAAATVLPAVAVGLYAWWLTGLGLPVLPSSVLSKSAASSGVVDGSGGVLQGLMANFVQNLREAAAPMIGVLTIGLAYAAWKRAGRDRVLALGMIAVVVLALMLGKMNSYARYEVYLLCVMGLGLAHLLQPELNRLLVSSVRSIVLGAGLCLLGAQLGVYVLATTPQAARNIDREQHQMHRLVAECWKKPVAVNDLGWVSFRNDAYVLDLFGLGNEEARKARMSGEADWMQRLVSEKGVQAAMIYPEWFADMPAHDWVHVGDIGFVGQSVTPFSPKVSVYATDKQASAELGACLQKLSETLPEDGRATWPQGT